MTSGQGMEKKSLATNAATKHYGAACTKSGSLSCTSCQRTRSSSDMEDKLVAQRSLLQRAANRVPCLGILCALMASLFISSASMLVKMTHSVHGIQVAVLSAFLQISIYGLIAVARGLHLMPKRGEYCAVMGRAILGAISQFTIYYAVKLIPLGDATTIRFSLPIWTLVISYLALREPINGSKIGAVLVSMIGVVLIAKPDTCVRWARMALGMTQVEAAHEVLVDGKPMSSHQQIEGSLVALGSAISLAISQISLRFCKRTATEVIIIWLSIFSIVIPSLFMLYMGEWRLPNNWQDCILILLNGLCQCAGQWFITSALKIEQSSVVALARTFDIEVAFFYSAFLLHEQIRQTSIIGSILVSSAVVAVLVPKWLESRRQVAEVGDPAGHAVVVGGDQGQKGAIGRQ